MKTVKASNRTAVTFQVASKYVNIVNSIIKKHNGQDGLFNNNIGGAVLNHSRTHYIPQSDTVGGTVTFHSHSCDHVAAAAELVAYLETLGCVLNERLIEVTKTHRTEATFKHAAGTPYKTPQTFLVSE